MLHFKISEFLRLRGDVQESVSTSIAEKIIQHHLYPLNNIRKQLGVPIHVTSGYRPEWWEIKQGRSGKSQHVFEGIGAVDVSLFGNKDLYPRLFAMLSNQYRRIAYYPEQNFVHLDYGAISLQCFIARDGSWNHVSYEDLIKPA